MANPVDLQLSALIDEELETAEFELLSGRLSRDAALRARYSRFAMIGEIVRDGTALLDMSFAERVRAGVEKEPSGPLPTLGGMQSYLRPVLGMAIAAAVAVVALVSLTPGPQMPITGDTPGLASQQTGPTYTVPVANSVGSSQPERLEYYFLRHGEYAPMARKSTYSRVIAEPVEDAGASSGADWDGFTDPAGQTPPDAEVEAGQ
jgi:negative regulator of sigma E activity